MSKELAKFEAEYKKKITGPLKSASHAEAKKLSKRIGIAHASAWEGEEYMRESMVPAHNAGITGTKLTDYMANKDFKDGYTTYKKSVESLAQDIMAGQAMQKEAKSALDAANKLDSDMAKDLKKRRDKSNSKSDIEKLHGLVKKAAADFSNSVAEYDKIPKGKRDYPLNFNKNVAAVLKTTPQAAQAKKESTELPQMLQDRNLKTNTNKAGAAIKLINKKADDAMSKAEEGDSKGAIVLLKDAAVSLKDLKKINDQYAKIITDKKMKAQIEDSKDKANIKKVIAGILKGYTDAERKVRGTMTTIKKAG